MKEQLISYETAKLAKEAGFPADEIFYVYSENGTYKLPSGRSGDYYEGYCEHGTLYELCEVEDPSPIPAPTQSLLQKWLREEHNF